MTILVELQSRNIRLADPIKAHIELRAGKLDHYLPAIEEAHVEVTYHKSARNAKDRNVTQITVRGKGLILRTEERADEILAAFDAAIDNLQRQIERYKGKHYHGRGDGRSVAQAVEETTSAEGTGDLPAPIAKRKQFRIFPMNELEAIEQMQLLGHNNFFIFYNADHNKINILYRRRDGSYGLIVPEIA